jgi:hypothetical protein
LKFEYLGNALVVPHAQRQLPRQTTVSSKFSSQNKPIGDTRHHDKKETDPASMNAQSYRHRQMNQELLPANHMKDFRPIVLDMSAESLEELTLQDLQSRNKSIFRAFDERNEGVASPPTVSRANPILSSLDDEDMREAEDYHEHVISPYPYSPSPEEIEERQHLTTHLGFDWSVRESVPLEEYRQEGMEGASESIDYSFYFENLPDMAHDVGSEIDDVSFIYDDGSVLDDKGFCLDQTEPSSIWDRDLSSPSRNAEDVGQVDTIRRLSPAQVSVGSGP